MTRLRSRPRGRALRDAVRDVSIDLTARRGRIVLLLLAVALSTGALVASIGISASASRQIGTDLAASTLGAVSVTVAPGGVDVTAFPADADARAAAVPLVTAAGLRLDLSLPDVAPSRLRPTSRDPQPVPTVQVFGATAGYLAATGTSATPAEQDLLDGHLHVVLLGAKAAHDLGVPTATSGLTGYRIWVNGHWADVVGILEGGDAGLADAVVVPYTEAVQQMGGDSEARMLVTTRPGAGAPVSSVLRTALRPDDPARLDVSQVADLASLRRGVSTQLTRLAAGVGALLLMLTALLVANSMIVSVVGRTAEIGLRRALGASRWAVARLFVLEGGMVGLAGGLAGSAVGAAAVVAVSAIDGWTCYLPPVVALAGPAVGLVVGIVASAYPARRAATVSPAVAIRVD